MESEIFGHERGAFTGASDRRLGCFELADGGTLLLDEIGENAGGNAGKLLRVLGRRKNSPPREQDGNIRERPRALPQANESRSGSEAVNKGDLRQDLFFRLNVFRISPATVASANIRKISPTLVRRQLLKRPRRKTRQSGVACGAGPEK